MVKLFNVKKFCFVHAFERSGNGHCRVSDFHFQLVAEHSLMQLIIVGKVVEGLLRRGECVGEV